MYELIHIASKVRYHYIESSANIGNHLMLPRLPVFKEIAGTLHRPVEMIGMIVKKSEPVDAVLNRVRQPAGQADNLSVIRKFETGVLVTKDGGVPGGVMEKLEAARTEHCRIVVVERAHGAEAEDRTWIDIDKFLDVLDCDLGSLKQKP
jgi:precorrin-6x reductase